MLYFRDHGENKFPLRCNYIVGSKPGIEIVLRFGNCENRTDLISSVVDVGGCGLPSSFYYFFHLITEGGKGCKNRQTPNKVIKNGEQKKYNFLNKIGLTRVHGSAEGDAINQRLNFTYDDNN